MSTMHITIKKNKCFIIIVEGEKIRNRKHKRKEKSSCVINKIWKEYLELFWRIWNLKTKNRGRKEKWNKERIKNWYFEFRRRLNLTEKQNWRSFKESRNKKIKYWKRGKNRRKLKR